MGDEEHVDGVAPDLGQDQEGVDDIPHHLGALGPDPAGVLEGSLGGVRVVQEHDARSPVASLPEKGTIFSKCLSAARHFECYSWLIILHLRF